MLQSLIVENYALIQRVEIRFENGFHVITGETGAGKSILVGALSLLLGQRADSAMVSDSSKKCIVEGVFDIHDLDLKPFFSQNDLDFDQHIIIRREINPLGKSRAFINDTPVGLNILKELSSRLFDIHSQHENLLIANKDFQLNLIDQYAQNNSLKETYQQLYKNFKKTENELKMLEETEAKALSDRDYYEFLFNELASSSLFENELPLIEEELNTLQNVESLKLAFAKIEAIMSSSEINVHSLLVEVKQAFSEIKTIYSPAQELFERLNSSLLELDDISAEAEKTANELSNNPERIAILTDRLNLINHLCVKHRVKDTNELIELMNDFDEKLQSISSMQDRIEACRKDLLEIRDKMHKAALNLSSSRKLVIPKIAKEISSIAIELAMPNIQLEFTQKQLESYNLQGFDEIDMLFSANKGMPLRPLDKIASGGELSRIMLAVKSIISERNLIPIVIFDEIDTGVSGDIASKVASIMKKMSKTMQVIAITHLPQIAAKADIHFWVFKQNVEDKTVSNIKVLSKDERVNEIAKMISNDTVSKISKDAAEELLGF